MGGSLAVHNKTTVRVHLTMSSSRVQLSRTCEPTTICTFTNIQPKTYEVKVAVGKEIVLSTTCEASGKLWNLTKNLQNEFKLLCAIETAFVSIRKNTDLVPMFKGKIVSAVDMKLLHRRSSCKTGLEVGWVLSQIGSINVDDLELGDSNPDYIKNTIEGAIANCKKEIVLVFREPIIKQKSNSEYRSEEFDQEALKPVLIEDAKEMMGEYLPVLEKDSFSNLLKTVSLGSSKENLIIRQKDEPKLVFSLPTFLTKLGISSWMKKIQSISRPKRSLQLNYEITKQWLLLNEAHGLQVECDKTLSQQLVAKLIDLFDREQKVMHEKQIHIGPDGDSESSRECKSDTWNVRKSLLCTTDLSEFLELRGCDNAVATPGALNPEHSASFESLPTEPLLCNGEKRASNEDQDNISLHPRNSSPPTNQSCGKPVVSDGNLCPPVQTSEKRISTVNDDRKFGYPFVESVNRLSNLGLTLNGLDPLKFLEHEVHYVQASLEAQEAITGEPLDIDSEEASTPGWKVVYVDGTSKFFWKHEDGRVALDPPFEEFWILLADPLMPSNPFPYPR